MKPALKKYSSKTLLNGYREMLAGANAAKETETDPAMLESLGMVTDWLLDRIDAYSPTAPARRAS